MLRITPQSSPDEAKRYYASADYYMEGQELLGRWGGQGARMLGLDGSVSRQEFNRLCDNLHPKTAERLTARTRDDRTVGYDFTFSVPKSVSLLYAMTEDQAVLDAFRDSVHEAMREIEAEMKTRVRKGGRNEERVTGNIAYGEFIHLTTRPLEDGMPDPQLHAHCFVFNATHDAEEGHVEGRPVPRPETRLAVLASGIPRAAGQSAAGPRLRSGTEARRFRAGRGSGGGHKAVFAANGQNRGSGSRARHREPGRQGPAGRLTREAKDNSLTWPELTSEWGNRLTPEERQQIEAVQERRGSKPVPERQEEAAVDFAIRHVFEREAVVGEKRLLAEALKHGLGAVTVEGVRGAYARRSLLVEERDGRRVVTTPEVLAEEERLVAFARDGRGTRRSLGVPGRPIQRDWLNAGQRQAVRHILSSHDRVILIRGAAGTGKTTLMQEAAEAIAEGGHKVVVLAPSAGASRDVLRGAGFRDADTVAMFLKSEAMQQRAAGQVIWVDEAGLLNSQDTAALFDAG